MCVFILFSPSSLNIHISGAPAAEGRQEEPHTHIREQKETRELIFSWVSWLAVLLMGRGRYLVSFSYSGYLLFVLVI